MIIKYVTFTVKLWCVSIQLVIFKNLKIHYHNSIEITLKLFTLNYLYDTF